MKKTFSLVLILILAVSSLFVVFNMPLGLAQSGTNVTGIIGQDATWASSGSPYTLTGNTLVDQGVTLTIQPGVTVNLGSYYIRVNGTLRATGNSNEKVTFNGGQISFTAASNGWNEQTGSGCLIDNAYISQTLISSSNPLKIDGCTINTQVSVTSSIISNNFITGSVSGSNSTISNNTVKGDITMQVSAGVGSDRSESSVISNNIVTGNINVGYFDGFWASGDTSTVSDNTVTGSITAISRNDSPQITDNTVSIGGIGCSGYGTITRNYVHGCQTGINLYSVKGFGGFLDCYATVKNNLVVDNTDYGIRISLSSSGGSPTITDNTISRSSIGILVSESSNGLSPTILNNNLQNNSDYNLYLSAPNINAINNWWGTTNQQAINQSIYDFKNDFNLGTVTYVPFLTVPNPQAPNVNTPIPTPTPSESQSTPIPSASQTTFPSPSVPEIPTPASFLMLFSTVLVATIIGTRKQGLLSKKQAEKPVGEYKL